MSHNFKIIIHKILYLKKNIWKIKVRFNWLIRACLYFKFFNGQRDWWESPEGKSEKDSKQKNISTLSEWVFTKWKKFVHPVSLELWVSSWGYCSRLWTLLSSTLSVLNRKKIWDYPIFQLCVSQLGMSLKTNRWSGLRFLYCISINF